MAENGAYVTLYGTVMEIVKLINQYFRVNPYMLLPGRANDPVEDKQFCGSSCFCDTGWWFQAISEVRKSTGIIITR